MTEEAAESPDIISTTAAPSVAVSDAVDTTGGDIDPPKPLRQMGLHEVLVMQGLRSAKTEEEHNEMVKKGLFAPHAMAKPSAEKTPTQSFYEKDGKGVLGEEGKGITVQSFENIEKKHQDEKSSGKFENIENKHQEKKGSGNFKNIEKKHQDEKRFRKFRKHRK